MIVSYRLNLISLGFNYTFRQHLILIKILLLIVREIQINSEYHQFAEAIRSNFLRKYIFCNYLSCIFNSNDVNSRSLYCIENELMRIK